MESESKQSPSFELSPTIIIGANHTGTRGLVEILNNLGSNSGKLEGPFLENDLFLSVTQHLIQKDSGENWLRAIYNVDFIKDHTDDLSHIPYIEKRLNNELESSYGENYKSKAWHWKCPSSALYLPTWLKLFPEAKIIFIKRPDIEVAESLYRRRELKNPFKAVRFNQVFNAKVENYLQSYEHVFRVNYHEFNQHKAELIDFLNMRSNPSEMEVEGFSVTKRKLLSSKRSLRSNLWFLLANFIIHLARWVSPKSI